jgi:hypothetical protein
MDLRPSRVGGFAAVALSAIVVAGCATMNVSSYVERGIDVRLYGTFNWGPADTFSTGDPRLDNNRFFDERVRMQVEKELAGRGFVKVLSGTPDLFVHYHASVTQEIDVRNLDREYGYCANTDCRPYVYDAGTLFVDLVDRRTNRLIWRGWAEGSVEGVIDNQDWMEARVDAAVTRILERLPRRL